MKCSKCGEIIYRLGAPHSEEIKRQYECECGNIETVLYTPEEMVENERRQSIAWGEPVYEEQIDGK